MVYNYSVNVSFPTEGKLHTCANIGIFLYISGCGMLNSAKIITLQALWMKENSTHLRTSTI